MCGRDVRTPRTARWGADVLVREVTEEKCADETSAPHEGQGGTATYFFFRLAVFRSSSAYGMTSTSLNRAFSGSRNFFASPTMITSAAPARCDFATACTCAASIACTAVM